MHEKLNTDTYYKFDDLQIIYQFGTAGSTDSETLMFKKCDSHDYTARYLFSELIDPDKEFDDNEIVANYEQISSFYIKGN